jgi:hypothetical protein
VFWAYVLTLAVVALLGVNAVIDGMSSDWLDTGFVFWLILVPALVVFLWGDDDPPWKSWF